jgi:hypothetical protein
MANSKKKIIDDVSTISKDFLQPIFGGDSSAPAGSPEKDGHVHSGGSHWGEVQKIDLTNHTTGRLTLQDSFVVARSVSSYPSVVATPTNVISGTLLNIQNSALKSKVALTIPSSAADTITLGTPLSTTAAISGTLGTQSGASPNPSNISGVLDGHINLSVDNGAASTNISSSLFPFTSPGIITSAIWYFSLPLDMDITKPSYFSFEWMGDILTTDGYGNAILDSSKLALSGSPAAQTTTFRITWQWYSAGYSIFAPAIIYDGYTPTNLPGTNINANTLTRGRLANVAVNELPFKLMVNDSPTNNPNYVNLTGLQQATGAVMLGVQVDVLSSGFVSANVGFQSGHLQFFQGNFVYLSKTMGSSSVAFKTF